VWSFFDEFVDAFEVVGHRLAVLHLHHFEAFFFSLLTPKLKIRKFSCYEVTAHREIKML
jgi:hypothetical protein